MPYAVVITDIGLAKIAAAITASSQITFAELAVGDSTTAPVSTQTALGNETARVDVNRVYSDAPGEVDVEAVIPDTVGGFTINEVGVYDSDGDLIIVAEYPPTYKPLLSEGAARTQVIRIKLLIAADEVIALSVDMETVLVTRDLFDEHLDDVANPHAVTPAQVFPGGAGGMVITRDTAGEFLWAAQPREILTKWENPNGPAFRLDGAGGLETAQTISIAHPSQSPYVWPMFAGVSVDLSAMVLAGLPSRDFDIWWVFDPADGTGELVALPYLDFDGVYSVRAVPNAIRLGGFHWGGDPSPAVAPDILPQSIWDLRFRPASPNPRGMVLVGGIEIGYDAGDSTYKYAEGAPIVGGVGNGDAGGAFWADIYMCGSDLYGRTCAMSGDGSAGGIYRNGVADPAEYGRWSWFEAAEHMSAHGKRLPTYAEFQHLALGVAEATGAGTAPTSNGYAATFRSMWGVEMATGNGPVWIGDGPALELPIGADLANTDGRGEFRATSVRWMAAGGDALGNGGSRALTLGTEATSDIRARGVCAHRVT